MCWYHVKKAGCDHFPVCNAEVKNGWSYAVTPLICLCGMLRDNFACHLHITRSFTYPKSIVNSGTFSDCLQVILSVIKYAF
jgi:hypothetical protein